MCYTSFKISSGNRSNTLFFYVMIVSQRHLSLYTLRYHSYIQVCPEHTVYSLHHHCFTCVYVFVHKFSTALPL